MRLVVWLGIDTAAKIYLSIPLAPSSVALGITTGGRNVLLFQGHPGAQTPPWLPTAPSTLSPRAALASQRPLPMAASDPGGEVLFLRPTNIHTLFASFCLLCPESRRIFPASEEILLTFLKHCVGAQALSSALRCLTFKEQLSSHLFVLFIYHFCPVTFLLFSSSHRSA